MNSRDFFTTVNLDFPNVEFDSFNRTFTHGYSRSKLEEKIKDIDFYNRGEINFFGLDPDIKDLIKKKLPVDLQSWIRNVRIAIIQGGSIIPHIDHRGLTVINYYFESGDAKTTFYSPKPNSIAFQAPGEYTNNLYKFDDVTKECQFIAKNNSCYLLNVSKIHSVDMESSDSIRKILQLTFNQDVTYYQVLEKLTQIGLTNHEMD